MPLTARVGHYRDARAANAKWFARGKNISVRSTVTPPIVIDPTRGDDARLYDSAGHEYLDFGFAGTDNFGFGSAHRRIQYASSAYPVAFLPEHDIFNTIGIDAKELLAERTPVSGPGIVYGARSGSDANEVVLDALIRARPDRRVFGCFEGAFHGRNTGSRVFMDPRKEVRIRNYPRPYETITLPFPHTMSSPQSSRKSMPHVHWATRCEQLLRGKRTAIQSLNGFFFEIVQGEGGVNIADNESLRELIDFLRRHDVAIVVDEVQSGMGRTGTLWAYERYDFLPDIVTMGKSLGGGVQDLSAVVMAERFGFRELGARSSTFGFEPAKSAAMLAAFTELNTLLPRVSYLATLLEPRLHRLVTKNARILREWRGLGAMFALEFFSAQDRDAVLSRAWDLGLLLLPAGVPEENPCLRIMPPFTISDDELSLGLDILQRVLEERRVLET